MNYKAPVASPFPGRTPSSHSHERDPPPFHSRAPRDQEGAQGAELARKLLATRGKSLVQQENLVSRPLQKMAVKNISCKMEEALISCALGKIQISACEKGIHEIKLQEDAVPESRGRIHYCTGGERHKRGTRNSAELNGKATHSRWKISLQHTCIQQHTPL
ncbi:methylated-DNA--protein-cysteine methyltransferase isoform X3 [Xenopus tropicalis]|uniref:Methylated-DNA--protein-cysteine methyltransferase isoform X3 n=1 Tax=Xenopus tropicalis TaxID=8364 RepID=A0A8J1JV41_XENTR|nr:methylated-DNA--protein-cysteine methyltransferase isoform X3 [Xenopus tropicalis]